MFHPKALAINNKAPVFIYNPFLKKLGRDLMRPIGNGFAAIGVTANAVTIAGLLFAAGCGLLFSRGQGFLAFLFLVASALCDMLDGAVARADGTPGTPMGAALDSTVDRYGEALILTGFLVGGLRYGFGEWFLWLWA